MIVVKSATACGTNEEYEMKKGENPESSRGQVEWWLCSLWLYIGKRTTFINEEEAEATPKDSNMKTTGQYIRMADKLYNEEIISTGKYEEMLLDAFREDLVFGDDSEEDEIID